jgi:DNA-binding XRE family transcriptional regulator
MAEQRAPMQQPGGTIYVIGVPNGTMVKIGSTRGKVEQRLQALQVGSAQRLIILATAQIDTNLLGIERGLHQLLAVYRQHGEWFELCVDQPYLDALILQARAIGIPEGATAREMSDFPLGRRVRQARREQGLTQTELGEKAGVNPITISRLERGHSEMAYASTVRELARALGMSADVLLGVHEELARDRQHHVEGA